MTVYLKKTKKTNMGCCDDNRDLCYFKTHEGCEKYPCIKTAYIQVFPTPTGLKPKRKVYLEKVKTDRFDCMDDNDNKCHFYGEEIYPSCTAPEEIFSCKGIIYREVTP